MTCNCPAPKGTDCWLTTEQCTARMTIPADAGTGTHDAILRDKPDPVHAGPLKSWREAEARVRADEPAPFRPGNTVFMAGWRSCQEQGAAVAMAAIAESGGGGAFTAEYSEGWRAACVVISRHLAAMRPEAPR